MHQQAKNRCNEIASDEPIVFADGYDTAIIGICWREGYPCVAYDIDRVIAILKKRDGMTRDEAEEFFEFNISGAWIGEGTPIFIKRI